MAQEWWMVRVPNCPCDICCVRRATRWFGQTSAVCCESPDCLKEHERRFAEGLREQEAVEEGKP